VPITIVGLQSIAPRCYKASTVKHPRRFGFAEDCLLASYASAIAFTIIAVLARSFPWPALLALLIVPTALLSTYQRYRAAAMCTGVAAIAAAWDIVPPGGSFALNADGVFAVLAFAAAATMTIVVTAWKAERRAQTMASNA